jgi:hypothetical protein
MQEHEKSINSGLVHVLLDGRRRVTKKDLREKYGVDKLVISQQTLQHPTGLEKYREDARRTSTPLSHFQLAEIEKISTPRFDKLLADLIKIPTGKSSATDYENAVEALLSALFFPSLSFPKKQTKIHEGRKRIDITYVNNSHDGFFRWLLSNYPAAHVFVECKNYGKEVENPELDQLSGRFGPSRGQVGLLVCRSLENEKLLSKRCIDTAHDQRGFIIHLTDEDLTTLVKDYFASNGSSDYPLLRRKFNALVM